MSSTVETLVKARSLIADSDSWMTRATHQRFGGTIRHCALGAVFAADGDLSRHCSASEMTGTEFGAVNALYNALPEPYQGRTAPESITSFNDWHATHEDILKLFDKAICESETTGSSK